MNLLAIDTARREGSIALLCDGTVAATAALGAAPGFGEVLFQAIERLLADNSLSLSDLDAFAAATGPGSFTGIRVGLVAAKSFAEAEGKPLVGVSNLRALASSARGDSPRLPLLDARRGELFAGFYDAGSEQVLPEAAGSWDDLKPMLESVGGPLVANEPSLFESGGPAAAAAGWPLQLGPAALAGSVAVVAAQDIAAGRAGRPEAVEANYIRRPSAQPPGGLHLASR